MEISLNQGFDAEVKKLIFQANCPSPLDKLNETSMQEIEFVVTENCQFEYRDKFIVTIGIPGQFGLSGLSCEDQKKFLIREFFRPVKNFSMRN